MVRAPPLFPNLSFQFHQFHLINHDFNKQHGHQHHIPHIHPDLSLALPPRLSPMSPKAWPRFTPFASSLSLTITILHNSKYCNTWQVYPIRNYSVAGSKIGILRIAVEFAKNVLEVAIGGVQKTVTGKSAS